MLVKLVIIIIVLLTTIKDTSTRAIGCISGKDLLSKVNNYF